MPQEKEFFRKNAFKKIQNPNELDAYIKVASPSVWTVLVAVIVFFCGIGFWGVFGTVESSVSALAVLAGGKATIYIAPEDVQGVKEGNTIRVNKTQGVLRSDPGVPILITADFDAYARTVGNLQIDDFVIPIKADLALPDGAYSVKLVTESIHPIAFLVK